MSHKNFRNNIWCESKPRKINLSRKNPDDIESIMQNMFRGGYPVVISSGRSGISILGKFFWDKNEISVFPFASQCVINALQAARITVKTNLNFTSDILINQWGIFDSDAPEKALLADSCDTFLKSGSTVLESRARFELWSLPKIIGSKFGAILWCSNESDSDFIRALRDSEPYFHAYLKKILRLLRNFSPKTYLNWEKIEFKSSSLTKFEYSTLNNDISEWDQIFKNRRDVYVEAEKNLFNKGKNTISKFTKDTNLRRIPTVLYTDISINNTSPKKFDAILHRVKFGEKPKKVGVYLLWNIKNRP